jgi:hypothetical protein
MKGGIHQEFKEMKWNGSRQITLAGEEEMK